MGEPPSTSSEHSLPLHLPAAQPPSPQMSAVSGISVISSQIGPEPRSELKRRAEERINQYQRTHRQNEEKLQDCLRSFLEMLPNDGCESIASDIVNSQTDAILWQVYHNLLTEITTDLLIVKADSRTPSLTTSPRTQRQINADIVAGTLPDESQLRDASFREACLQRDRQCCVITNFVETEHWVKIGSPATMISGDLEAAHIIPYSFGACEGKTLPVDSGPKWEVLSRCFPGVRRAGMRPENINDPANGLTLLGPLHLQFGKFRMAFQPTETPHTYRLKTYPRFSTYLHQSLPESRTVTFTKADDAGAIPRPSAALLDCHFRLAEILHASGMGEYIEKKMRDWDTIKCGPESRQLSADGSTDVSRYLQAGLWNRISVS
ncbi:hypothetical protein ASPZODRAFT_69075 [Penicilliopsis zonata CBS 506.65]|uniref:HNH nuclease domain-containing protein n=1 Tax=Penicilliopsis zonata CBS 506.65 TaxID=1073090 RepID=A0A1L9SFA5_9EURO|nr:hypothetical protein ASPZODRAFT_69075 [Penicilliopsis zonata CBS 506.65]OJJ45832.1 hypothetical protein ASPZODRAFT_69075 [Penicilliopsis zonata CBS 506.65]